MIQFLLSLMLFIISAIIGLSAMHILAEDFPVKPKSMFARLSGTGAMIMGVTSLICMGNSAFSWSTHNWLQDVRTGTVWSIGTPEQYGVKEIKKTVSFGTFMTVAEPSGNKPCLQRGRGFILFFGTGTEFRVEVIGKAKKPDYRYLIDAVSDGLDPRCTHRFLVTGQDLARIKWTWKQELPVTPHVELKQDQAVANEVSSVQSIH